MIPRWINVIFSPLYLLDVAWGTALISEYSDIVTPMITLFLFQQEMYIINILAYINWKLIHIDQEGSLKLIVTLLIQVFMMRRLFDLSSVNDLDKTDWISLTITLLYTISWMIPWRQPSLNLTYYYMGRCYYVTNLLLIIQNFYNKQQTQ